MDCHIFSCETMVWQCFIEGHEDLFQGNFANNNTYGWRDLLQFTTKINCVKLQLAIRYRHERRCDDLVIAVL